MNFVSTGVKEVTRRLLRQRNRLALSNARKLVEKAEGELGRHHWQAFVDDETIREPVENLRQLDGEVAVLQARIGEVEGRIREQEAEREKARQEHQAALQEIDRERHPAQEKLQALEPRHAEQLKTLHEQGTRKAVLQHEQAALARAGTRRERSPLPEEAAAEHRKASEERQSAIAGEQAALEGARATAIEGVNATEQEIAQVRAELAVLQQRARAARLALIARERAVTVAIAGMLKEIAATRREVARIEERKADSYVQVGRRIATLNSAPTGGDDLFAETRRYRLSHERLAGLEAAWEHESRLANKQDLRIFNFVAVTSCVLIALGLLLFFHAPPDRDWLPAGTEAILSLNVGRFTDADFARALESQEPGAWEQVWTGLMQKVTEIPQIDVRRQVSRITHALAPAAVRGGPAVDYLLVEMHTWVEMDQLMDNWKKFGFPAEPRDFRGLPIYEKPGIAIARVGPYTLAVGSTESVEELIQVRLGLKDDLKSDAPLFTSFQHLDDQSAFRLVTQRDLMYLSYPLLDPKLVADCQALRMTLNLREPVSAYFVMETATRPVAEQVAKRLGANPDQVLQLQSTGLNLFIEPPSVRTRDTQVEWRFKMTGPAAREFLQRVARVGGEAAAPANAVAGR